MWQNKYPSLDYLVALNSETINFFCCYMFDFIFGRHSLPLLSSNRTVKRNECAEHGREKEWRRERGNGRGNNRQQQERKTKKAQQKLKYSVLLKLR